jgi:FtsP/CotA-like multicopper oxidase with cupredoxin domain
LNGEGVFNCDDAVPARPLDCLQRSTTDLPVLQLDGGKRIALRVVNVGSYAGIELEFKEATMLPLRVDGGHSVSSHPAKQVGLLHPGERIDLLVEQQGETSDPRMSLEVSLDTSVLKYPNPSLTPTHRFPVEWYNMIDTMLPDQPKYEHVSLEELRSEQDQSVVLPVEADRTMVLYTITQKLAHLKNEPRGFINHTTWTPQSDPASPLIALDRELWDKNQLVPHLEYNIEKPQWVDIVLNNLDEEDHPFHLHGFDFWVLSTYSSDYNWGSFNPFEDDAAPGGDYDLTGAVKRDTVAIPRRGYAVLRLKIDNPGIWMFHCHNLWHQASGMAMAFEVS